MSNTATSLVTVYSPDGDAIEVSRLNANDLIRHSGYTWNLKGEEAEEASPSEDEEQAKIAATADKINAAIAAKNSEAPDENNTEVEAKIDHDTAPLEEIAKVVADLDVEKYLEGFTADALRAMAEKRYGERVHHKSSKEKVIEKIIGFEEAKTAAELDD